MSGGSLELHRDDTPFAYGTHKGPAGEVLKVKGADFKSCGVQVGVLLKNVTKESSGTTLTVTEEEITAVMTGGTGGEGVQEPLTGIDGEYLYGIDGELLYGIGEVPSSYWDYGDEYEIYLTDTEDTLISSIWTDRRYGRKSERRSLHNGLRPEDIDLDEYESHVFGPGQPIRG